MSAIFSMAKFVPLILFIFLSFPLFSQPVLNDFSDRILKFHSSIEVLKNGKIKVSEHIRVYNGDGENSPGYGGANSFYANNDIKRGIVRDFPTRYADTSGYWTETGFNVKKVLKNNREEPYKIENLNNGKRVLIGREEVILEPGVYDYVIEYETIRQLLFHADKDELYWNVNGNGWVFTADTISCIIQFPQGAKIKEYACYTGVQGSTENDCRAQTDSLNSISFLGTRRFTSYEGMTVAVAIEKGTIEQPGAFKKMMAFLSANYIIPALLSLLLVQFCYYLFVWYRKGRDPRKGVIYPQFSPPPGINAADAGFILEQKFSSNLFAAALIDCAVKKNLQIEVKKEGLLFKSNVYYFNRPPDLKVVQDTSADYGFSLSSLYGQKAEKGKYNSTLRSCYTALHNALKDHYQVSTGKKNKKTGMFVLNKGYILIGFLMILAGIFLSVHFFSTHPSLTIAIFIVSFILALVIVHLIFRNLMSAYTKEGRQVVDHLLGFKMYLSQAEKHVYNQLAPPEKTLELFEKYFPYAVALDVENKWAEKFDDIMQRALAAGYTPGYYSISNGTINHFTMSDISRGISSGLSSTISSASTPPSSSGSGGGGSSGGGGGGGGGGGW